jgi:hypothetical protein
VTGRTLSGLGLRSWLAVELHDSPGPVTVAELTERLHQRGLQVDGRPSKTISDALRWEVRRGRIHRLARGLYTAGRLARTTLHRMRQRIHATLTGALLSPVVAPTRNETHASPPTPRPATATCPTLETHVGGRSPTVTGDPPRGDPVLRPR